MILAHNMPAQTRSRVPTYCNNITTPTQSLHKFKICDYIFARISQYQILSNVCFFNLIYDDSLFNELINVLL